LTNVFVIVAEIIALAISAYLHLTPPNGTPLLIGEGTGGEVSCFA